MKGCRGDGQRVKNMILPEMISIIYCIHKSDQIGTYRLQNCIDGFDIV